MSTEHRTWRATVATLATVAVALAPLHASAQQRAPEGEPGSVEVYSTLGAVIEIDGERVGTIEEDGVPLEAKVYPGEHTIRASKRGYTERNSVFTVQPGGLADLDMELQPVAGIVRITTDEPGATVKVNGKVLGKTPFDQDIPFGETEIEVSHPGYFTDVRTLRIVPGQEYDIQVDLKQDPDWEAPPEAGAGGVAGKWWFWTALGVVVAGGATAAAVALSGGEDAPPRPDATLSIP
ncbi:MAG: PEGA domain-containing protein [Myxococcota bacterium]